MLYLFPFYNRVPLFLYEALHKYAVLLRPLSEDLDEDVLLPLDEGIYVPRSEVHSGCNGLMFYEANYQGQTFSNFCEMKHGEIVVCIYACIGYVHAHTVHVIHAYCLTYMYVYIVYVCVHGNWK